MRSIAAEQFYFIECGVIECGDSSPLLAKEFIPPARFGGGRR